MGAGDAPFALRPLIAAADGRIFSYDPARLHGTCMIRLLYDQMKRSAGPEIPEPRISGH
jgi:hypothetical protein